MVASSWKHIETGIDVTVTANLNITVELIFGGGISVQNSSNQE
jgi:hypothetical protein